MGLEPESLRPTFRLRPGEAGVSTALHVAARYGMPVDVVEEARGVLPEAHRDLQDRLARIDSLRAAAERDAVRAAAERIDLEADRVRLADELARARRREHEAIRGEVDGLWRSIHALREELRGARRLLPAGSRPSPETLRRAADLVESAAARLVPGGDVAAALGGPPPGESVPPEAFGDGDTVHVATVGREGILVGRERDVAVVAFGTLKVRAPWGAIRRIRRAEPAPAGSTGRAVSPPSDAGPPRWTPRSPDNTIDLRGLRVDEAVDRLDERLDRLFQADAATAYVVHGHGTGAVRRAVREHLRNHPLSGESRPGEPSEGGDGVTVVRLR
jgi:DNA mismatch repair protein MutS2